MEKNQNERNSKNVFFFLYFWELPSVISTEALSESHAITRVSESKYLGVVLDERLSWSAHVKHVISRAGKRVGIQGA